MTFFDKTVKIRSAMALACGASLAALTLSGCMSSPTYGTDKTANEQLIGDMTNILQIAPKQRPNIDYKPRPALVKPLKGEAGILPAPQENVATAANPAWPESPEQKRARLRADADENLDDPSWTPQIDQDLGRAQAARASSDGGAVMKSDRAITAGFLPGETQKAQSEAFRRKLAANKQGSSTSRRYLSEPPIDYRQVAENAPVGDVGEDELKKERRLKAEARKKGDKGWGDLWPF